MPRLAHFRQTGRDRLGSGLADRDAGVRTPDISSAGCLGCRACCCITFRRIARPSRQNPVRRVAAIVGIDVLEVWIQTLVASQITGDNSSEYRDLCKRIIFILVSSRTAIGPWNLKLRSLDRESGRDCPGSPARRPLPRRHVQTPGQPTRAAAPQRCAAVSGLGRRSVCHSSFNSASTQMTSSCASFASKSNQQFLDHVLINYYIALQPST